MTTFRQVELTCAVCGHTYPHTVLTSTFADGSPDLDTRPPPPARLALPMQVQCCPYCGYCAPNIAEAPVTAREVVARPDYQAQLADARFPYLANMFLCQSLVQEAAGEAVEAGWAAVHAAWACDDAGQAYIAAAVRCRIRAVALFDRAREAGHSFAETPAVEAAILADLLRRSGHFEEAKAAIARGLAHHPGANTRPVLLFQHLLCERQDTAAHTVQEALDTFGE